MVLTRRQLLSGLSALSFCPDLQAARIAPVAEPTCLLPESRAGFAKALAGRDLRNLRIWPAAGGWSAAFVEQARSGALVILESGSGFSSAGAFEEQRAGLEAMGLTLEPPLALWRDGNRSPYFDLEWPARARVRDFSVVVPVRGGEAIGRIGHVPAAALRRTGAGALLVLGSPLGPALWSDDAQACAWLSSVCAAAAKTASSYPSC
jgi:hypothetical protein